MRPLAFAFALCLAPAVAATAVSTAWAEPPAPVAGEVFVVLAKEEAGEMDPALAKMPALRNPPFKSFQSMKVLSRQQIALVEEKPVTVKLPNGRELRIELLERMADGRHKVQVSINQPSKKDYLPLLQVKASEEPFFVAGQKYEGGTLVIGVRVGGATKPGTATGK
jgi:hypothetical protein